MRYIICTLLCILTLQVIAGDSLQLYKLIPIPFKLFTTDRLGNTYAITTNNKVYRYNKNGDSTAFYNPVLSGNISQIDATNPMKILVHFANANKVVILDQMLTAKSTINFNGSGIYQTPTVAYSADGNIWAYDAVNMQLQKVQNNGTILPKNTSQQFMQLFGENVQPLFITEQDRTLFAVDSTLGIFKFDAFGNYINTYAFYTNEIQYINGCIIYLNKNKDLVSYNTVLIQEKILPLPKQYGAIIQARAERNTIYLLTDRGLFLFN